MVYTNRPITKYCCSDSIRTEARILAMFSIINTSICLFILFLIYAHTQSEYSSSRRFDETTTFKSNGEEFPNSALSQTTGRLLRKITTQVSTTSLAPVPVQPTVQNDETEIGNNTSSYNNKIEEYTKHTHPSISTSAADEAVPPLSVLEEGASSEDIATKYRLDSFPIMKVKTTNAAGERESSESTTMSEFISENATTSESITRHVHFQYSTLITPTLNSLIDTTTFETATRIQLKTNQTVEAGANNITRSEKIESSTMLDWMASFLLWEHNMAFNRVMPLVLWNVMDLLRGIILFIGISKNINALLVAWYLLTSLHCLAAVVLLVPITNSLTSGSYQAIFILLFLIVLMYNIYGLWIVNLVLKETRNVKIEEEVSQIQDSHTGEAIPNEDQHHFETPVQKF